MKTRLLLFAAALFMASCSAPKYAYKFDYHDYNAGRKNKQAAKEVASNPGPVEIQPEMLVSEAPVVAPSTTNTNTVATEAKSRPAPLTMSKAERKQMVKELKAMVKSAAKMKNADDRGAGSQAMDHDLKLSLIFLLVSVLAGVLFVVSPYLTYVVGTVAFILAVVFFVKWLIRQ